MNGAANPVERVKVTEYPSYYLWVKDGKKKKPIKYSGDEEVNSIVEWLKENSPTFHEQVAQKEGKTEL
jgi:hypothetical protein